MADDEQFSLCWNNFNSNLSAGFHESLCRGDLVDVTLAAEGQFVKAHRLVLSVCSPYFRRMFTQMPANQHAFVFLKDVSHSALKDLIQFMYCGEVNVKQDALPAFISTAEALQIKGLTDSDPAPSQSPAKPSTPAPQPQQITAPQMTTASTTTSPRARTSNQRSRYKLESEDSGDETKPTNQQIVLQAQPTHQQQTTLVQQHTQKRPAQRSITPHTAPTVKRIKNNDPLEGTDATTATTTTTQITVQAVTDSKSGSGEPEYIDLPIDLPTKSEPVYAEEAADDEVAEQEATYVEDDSYGDMKYDESYFTENDEAGGAAGTATTSGAVVKQSASFSDTYVSDSGEQQQQQATEAQELETIEDIEPTSLCDDFSNDAKSSDKTPKEMNPTGSIDDSIAFSEAIIERTDVNINYDGFEYGKSHVIRKGIAYFPCINYRSTRCPAALYLENDTFKNNSKLHNHSRKNEEVSSIKTAIAEGGVDYEGFKYHKSGVVKNGVIYYRCSKFRSNRCPATLQIEGDKYRTNKKEHNHSPKEKVDALSGRKLCYDGFYFYRHGKCEYKIYWRCSTPGCCVRLHTDLDGNFISIRGEHKHS